MVLEENAGSFVFFVVIGTSLFGTLLLGQVLASCKNKDKQAGEVLLHHYLMSYYRDNILTAATYLFVVMVLFVQIYTLAAWGAGWENHY